MKRTLMLAATTALLVAPTCADAAVTAEVVRCLQVGSNSPVHATATDVPPGATSRLFFRWEGHDEYFWIDMEIDGAGSYWTLLPKPERRNDQVEYYSALVDSSKRELQRSAPVKAKVNGDCKVELTERQAGVAANLTVGETAPHQQGKPVLGFLCDGIVTRINWQGIRRSDEVCRACVVASFARKAVLLPATGVTGVLIVDNEPEPSPARP